MIVSDVVGLVQRTVGDQSGVQFTEQDIMTWIQMAQREVISQNESVLQTQATQNLVVNQGEYPFPADLMIHRTLRVQHRSESKFLHLKPYSLTEFDRLIDGWDQSTRRGVPEIYTAYDNKFFIYPTPDYSRDDGFKVIYSRKPVPATQLSDPIDIPEEYHNLIIRFCLSMANTQDEDYEAATLHTAQVQADIRTMRHRQNVTNRETYPTITVLPEDMW